MTEKDFIDSHSKILMQHLRKILKMAKFMSNLRKFFLLLFLVVVIVQITSDWGAVTTRALRELIYYSHIQPRKNIQHT